MLDSTCTSHTTHKEDIVVERKLEDIEIATADSKLSIQAKYRGNVRVTAYDQKFGETEIKLTEILCVPKLREHLMSVPNLVRKGKYVIFDNEGAAIYETNTNELIAKETFEDNTFKVNLAVRVTGEDRNESCLRTNESKKELLHRRFGHINSVYLNVEKKSCKGIRKDEW